MYYDPSGHIAFFVVTAIVGAVVGFGLAAYNDYSEDDVWFNGSVGSYIGYTLVGAAVVMVVGLSALSLLAGNFLASCGQVYTGLKGLALAYTMGGTGGTFVSPYYTDPMSLSLPYHQMSNMANPTMFVVNQPITVTAGQAVPWFGQYGGGIQYLLPQTIQELINSGILSRF